MKEIVANKSLIAACGLYCGACRSYLKGKCPACAENSKASWCKIRSCCAENSYASCADCKEFADPMQCKKYNNFIGRMFGLVFRSDRSTWTKMIKRDGYENFAKYMTTNKLQTIKRGTKI